MSAKRSRMWRSSAWRSATSDFTRARLDDRSWTAFALADIPKGWYHQMKRR
jgi:hypothetical protein